MIDSLSSKLNLKVNGHPIILTQELSPSDLRNHEFKKPGVFFKLAIKPGKNDIIYWSKNCKLTYFEEGIMDTIFPIIDDSRSRCGTSSYLIYKQNRLSKFTFQIIQNKMTAIVYLKNFKEKILEHIGNPISADKPFIVWEIEHQNLVLEYPIKEHGYIHLSVNE